MIGNTVNGLTLIANGEYFDIKPSSGVEWIIHNITYDGAVELYFSDGTNNLNFDSDTGKGARLGFVYRCTNTRYYRVKNVSGAPILVGFDGIQSL